MVADVERRIRRPVRRCVDRRLGRWMRRPVRRWIEPWTAPIVRDWREHGSAYEVARMLTAPARRILVRLDVQNADSLPSNGPVIIVANHLSFIDSVLLMFALPRPVAFLGKAEYTEHRFTKWLFCGAGMIPIRRENPTDLVRAFEQVGEVLDHGEVVALFPEGTRSRDGLLHRGHSGAAHLALASGASLVPVGIVGTDAVLPTGATIVRPFRRATIRVGSPIRPADEGWTRSTNRSRRAITDRVMAEIQQLCHQEYIDRFAPIPVEHRATTPASSALSSG
jgi:1-acyl-sn-glycerol-3-phosphate acyltransferase